MKNSVANFDFQEVIHQDGCSTLYRAKNQSVEDELLVQVYLPNALDPSELKIQLILRHPNIVKVIWHGNDSKDNRIKFLVMHFPSLGNLRKYLPMGFPIIHSLDTIEAVASALLYLHSQGIGHGAVTPQNIFFTSEYHAVLGPLRISSNDKFIEEKDNLFYVAPELLIDPEQKPSPTSDIFSFGIVCYELLCGKLPYDTRSSDHFIESLFTGPKKLSQLASFFPEELDSILMRCVASQSHSRYASIKDFLLDFYHVKEEIIENLDSGKFRSINLLKQEKYWTLHIEKPVSHRDYIDLYVENPSLIKEDYKSTIIRGYHTHWQKEIVLKYFHSTYEMRRIQKNIILTSKAESKRIVAIQQAALFWESRRNSYYVTEYYTGNSLHEWRKEPHSILQKLQVLEDIAEGLVFLHQRNIIHGNLNPKNILVEDNRAYIKNFESADAKHYHDLDDGRMAKIGEQRSFCYLDPSIFEGANYSPAFDIYSLGVIAYELISGILPYGDQSLRSYLQRLGRFQRVRRLSLCSSQIPDSLDLIVMNAITPKYEVRITNATMFLLGIQQVIQEIDRKSVKARTRRRAQKDYT